LPQSVQKAHNQLPDYGLFGQTERILTNNQDPF